MRRSGFRNRNCFRRFEQTRGADNKFYICGGVGCRSKPGENDRVLFNGSTVMSDSWAQGTAPTPGIIPRSRRFKETSYTAETISLAIHY